MLFCQNKVYSYDSWFFPPSNELEGLPVQKNKYNFGKAYRLQWVIGILLTRGAWAATGYSI